MSTNIVFIQGNLFESKMHTLVNAINTVGVMGKGIAKEFKIRYPDMFLDYQDRCKNDLLKVGIPYIWIPDMVGEKWILNFPTKKHWKDKSKIEWIEQGLAFLQKSYAVWGIQSLAVPALGSGLGGIKWDDVRPLLENYLGMMHIPVEIYEPISVKPLSSKR